MVSSTPAKTGRPIAVHKTARGEKVVGLFRLKDGRWRASGPEKWTFSERDEDLPSHASALGRRRRTSG